MKTKKKIILIVVGVLVALAIVGFSLNQTSKNLVNVQTGKVVKQDISSYVTASGEVRLHVSIDQSEDFWKRPTGASKPASRLQVEATGTLLPEKREVRWRQDIVLGRRSVVIEGVKSPLRDPQVAGAGRRGDAQQPVRCGRTSAPSSPTASPSRPPTMAGACRPMPSGCGR